MILRDAVGNLWQALERVGYKNRTQIPNPFELPEEGDMPLALSPATEAAPSKLRTPFPATAAASSKIRTPSFTKRAANARKTK